VTFLELFETLRIELNLDKRRDVKLSIALVYPKRDGKFSVTPITELSVYAPNIQSSRAFLAFATRLTRIKFAFLPMCVCHSVQRKKIGRGAQAIAAKGIRARRLCRCCHFGMIQ
jgi:hypothetical protein